MGFARVDNRRMDRFHLRPGGRRARWARPATVALALAAARAEAARLQREVAWLDLKIETLAEAHAGVQARLEGLIQASHRHQADLERSELALRVSKAEYAGDVRDLHARGPLAPPELLLAAGDMHERALATGAAGAARARTLGFAALADVPAPIPTAAAAVRTALGQVGKPYRWGRPDRRPWTAPGWSAWPTLTPGCRCRGPRASSGRPAAMSRWPTCAPATWCSSPTTRTGRPPSTTSACTAARA
jgi:hypothetical protein